MYEYNFFFNTNDALQRKPTTFRVLLFKSITFFNLIKNGNFLKRWEIYFLIFFKVKIFEKAHIISYGFYIRIKNKKVISLILSSWNKLFLILLNSILPFKVRKLFFSFYKFFKLKLFLNE